MHTRAETEQLACISIKKVKNVVQADEKPVSLSAENDLGSSKWIRTILELKKGRTVTKPAKFFLNFGGFPPQMLLASHFQCFYSGFLLLEISEQ